MLFLKILQKNDIVILVINAGKNVDNFYLLDIFKKIILKKINLNKIMDIVDDNNTGAWASQLCIKYKFPTQVLHASVNARYLSKSKKFIKPFSNKISKLNIRNFTNSLIFIIEFSYIQGLGLLNIILSWRFNSIIRLSLLRNLSMFLKNNKFNPQFVYKNFFSTKKINLFLKICKELSQNNLYPSTFLSVGTWLFHRQKYHFSSFSLIQKMSNIFGKHNIRIKY